MWNPFKRPSEEHKSATITDIDLSSNESVIILLGQSGGEPINIQPRDAYFMSERNGDLGGAVQRISESIANFRLAIDAGDENIYEHPILDLLNNPGEGKRKIQFWNEIAESMLLTSECWFVARGNVNNPPLSLCFIRPYEVSIVFNPQDGFPQTIETQSPFDSRIYTREIINGSFRYLDYRGLNEIIPIIGLTNLSDGFRGRCPLSKLFYDVKMNTDGKRHNVSLLTNGARISAMVTPAGTNSQGGQNQWNEKSVQALESKFRGFYQGSGNAGNVMILSQPAALQSMIQNNVDMDFVNLLKISRESIYNLYKIPLPLILSDAMTLNNYTIAQRSYYTKAVIPVFDNIADGIMQSLKDRYGFTTEKLTYSEVDIKDLREVLVENMVALKNSESVTINEIRNIGGFEDDEAGDVILIGANKVPLDTIGDTQNTFSALDNQLPMIPEQAPPIPIDEIGKSYSESEVKAIEDGLNDKFTELDKKLSAEINNKPVINIIPNPTGVDMVINKKGTIKKTITYTDINGKEKTAEIIEEAM